MRRKSGKKLILLGPDGSFSSMAADRLGKEYQRRYVGSFSALFYEVRGDSFGLIPIMNKIVGPIKMAVKFLKKKRYLAVRKFRIPIRMALVVRRRVALNEIQRVYAPLIVKKQCRIFIKKYLPAAAFYTDFASSSLAFKKIVQLKREKAYCSAAIGSEKAAKIFKLHVLARNIQDDPHDWTEFVLFQKRRIFLEQGLRKEPRGGSRGFPLRGGLRKRGASPSPSRRAGRA
ncbi:hypothetical protein HYW83_00320 [Candidatus Peregrinibacteria bacterium]|nr:hypothetical protein [Candidatus Peregrinibacteria bacterium]